MSTVFLVYFLWLFLLVVLSASSYSSLSEVAVVYHYGGCCCFIIHMPVCIPMTDREERCADQGG